MIGQNLVARETEILKLLRVIHGSRLSYTVIGGYAVDAYSPLPRYSTDCDVVIEEKDLEAFSGLLRENGFNVEQTIYKNVLEGLQTKNFVKIVGDGTVTAELMVAGVKCRQTEAIWRATEIGGSSAEMRIVCVDDSVTSRVASREMLIVLKLHSGRDTDHRDIVMLAEDADWKAVRELCERGISSKLREQLSAALTRLGGADFEGTVKSAFRSKQSQSTRIAIAASKIKSLLGTLS